MLRIFWGLVAIGGGYVIIRYVEWLLNNIGRMEFFERKLGNMGGSRLGYKLLGILLIAIGFAMVTNLIDGFADWLAGFFIPDDL
jgi:hypothetical protein